MGYVVTTEGHSGIALFLVDRRRTKSRWWATDVTGAMIFEKQSAAEIQARKLRYKKPEVITVNEAAILSRQNDDRTDDIHPFSEEAFG